MVAMNTPTDDTQDEYEAVMRLAGSKAIYEDARARLTQTKATNAELDLEERRGNLLQRSTFRDATVVAFSILAQSLQSLPDQMERRAGLTPAQAQIMADGIAEALKSVGEAFKGLSGEL